MLLLSSEYFAKNWTNHELRAAQSRVLWERCDYIFSVMLSDDIALPKPFESFAYVRYAFGESLLHRLTPSEDSCQ